MHVLVCPVERAGAIGIVPGNHFQIKSHDSHRGISMRNENANAISQENGFAIMIFCPTSHRLYAVRMKNESAMIFVHGCITGESCGPFW